MSFTVHIGDVLDKIKSIPDESVQCCVTSPPYWGLRDYGHDGQLGLEKTPEEYVQKMVQVFREVNRVLRKDGTLWLNLGDSYARTGDKGDCKDPKHPEGRNGQSVAVNGKIAGLKPKDLVGIPWRVAFALQVDGWWLRQDIIWAKPNPMPESVTDRCTKSHEYIFLLTKRAKYYYDADAVKEDSVDPESLSGRRKRNHQKFDGQQGSDTRVGFEKLDGQKYPERNARSVWTITTQPYPGSHFATFPEAIPERCIKAGSKKGDMILDPFTGSGTTGEVALRLERNFVGIELNEKYAKELAIPRLENVCPLFAEAR